MNKMVLLLILLSIAPFSHADDQLTVNLNGQNYTCGSSEAPKEFRFYCSCESVGPQYIKAYLIKGFVQTGVEERFKELESFSWSGTITPDADEVLMARCNQALRGNGVCRSR